MAVAMARRTKPRGLWNTLFSHLGFRFARHLVSHQTFTGKEETRRCERQKSGFPGILFTALAILFATMLPQSAPKVQSAQTVSPNGIEEISAIRPYSGTSFWNVPIPADPAIDPNSNAIVAKSIVPYAAGAAFSNSDAWGISYIDGTTKPSKPYTVACTRYCKGDTVVFSIPPGARPTTGSDHHLAVINGKQELDMWLASYDPAKDAWSAGVRVVNDLSGEGALCARGQHCNGAEASGFALLGGTIRPAEIERGHIDHALAMITPYTRAGYIACPATHTDGKAEDPAAIPEGAHVQLDPAVNVDAQPWPVWEKIIAKALQTYGAYIVDTGGALAVRGVTDQNQGGNQWASVRVPKGGNISDIPWRRLRVLRIQPCN